jgi:hypothetical protein
MAQRIAANIAKLPELLTSQAGCIIKLATSEGASTMLRKTIHATLIVILMMGAASAQVTNLDPSGFYKGREDRTDREKKDPRAIDRDYQSTIKKIPDAEKKKSDPWGDVRPAAAPPAAAKNKQ